MSVDFLIEKNKKLYKKLYQSFMEEKYYYIALVKTADGSKIHCRSDLPLKKGDTVKVRIISIDYDRGKVGLTMKGIKQK